MSVNLKRTISDVSCNSNDVVANKRLELEDRFSTLPDELIDIILGILVVLNR